jgi:molybdate transport system permease protein
MDWQALELTLRLALLTTLILVVLGTPIAWWLATTQRPWRGLVHAIVALPLVLPPTVLGFYLLVAMGPDGPIGTLTTSLGIGRLPFTFAGILVASVIYSLPFMVQPLTVAFAGVDRSLLEASWTLGRSGFGTFLRIVVPLTATGFLTAAVLTFAHTVGEFGVVLMIGGNIPGRTRVLSIAIYEHVETIDYASAHALSALLLGFSFTVLALVYWLNRAHAVRVV